MEINIYIFMLFILALLWPLTAVHRNKDRKILVLVHEERVCWPGDEGGNSTIELLVGVFLVWQQHQEGVVVVVLGVATILKDNRVILWY